MANQGWMARSHCNAESFNKFPKLGNSFNKCTLAAESLHALMKFKAVMSMFERSIDGWYFVAL